MTPPTNSGEPVRIRLRAKMGTVFCFLPQLGLPRLRQVSGHFVIFPYLCHMKGRNLWKYLPKKENYSKLFNEDDRAKLEYHRNSDFRDFVENWDKDNPNLLGWTLTDFYKAYTTKEPTLF